jgi:hypothetical protein
LKSPTPDKGKYKTHKVIEGKTTKTLEYSKWYAMVSRGYSENYKSLNSTYLDCTLSENFKSFQYFAKWCNEQQGFLKEFHLDKDILSSGNKEYSEDMCCFLPRGINNFLCDRSNDRGELPLGVSINTSVKNGKTYSYIRARVSSGVGVSHNLGNFSSVTDAFYAYKECKEKFAKELAAKWQFQIDPRAYQALMSYEVLITD